MKDLVTKLTKAAVEVGGKLKADKTNIQQKYNYLSADKILSVCGQALFEQGIAVIPQVSEQEVTLTEYTDDYNKTKRRYDCRVKFSITVTDGESSIASPWFGMGSDYSVPDKALYKAITSGHKYFLMKLLCIGEGNEDSEHDGEEEQPKNQPAPAQRKPEPAPAHTNGTNGQVAPAERPNQKLINRWSELYEQAGALGLTVESIDPAKITADELTAKGKALAARISAVEKEIA